MKVALTPLDRIILFMQVENASSLDAIRRTMKNPFKSSVVLAIGSGIRMPSEQLLFKYFFNRKNTTIVSSMYASLFSQSLFYPFDVLRNCAQYREEGYRQLFAHAARKLLGNYI